MNIPNANPVALITGAAKRIGLAIACELHDTGFNTILHYRNSENEAQQLANKLNTKRANSAALMQGDLLDSATLPGMIAKSVAIWERLDLLVNNASSFYPTPIGTINEHQWDDLIGSNLKAPLFLSQAAAPSLRQNSGSIINLCDIHVDRPLADHPLYIAAKSGLVGLTKALARDLAPSIRVNGIAPGAILWPESMDNATREKLTNVIPLQKPGAPVDIAKTVVFLATSNYITGQIIAVDGGRSIRSS